MTDAAETLIADARRMLRRGFVAEAESALTRASDDPAQRQAAEIELAHRDLLRYAPPEPVVARLDSWLAADDLPPLLRARCLIVKGIAENRLGHAMRAIDAMSRAAEICTSDGLWATAAKATDGLGTVYVWRGRHDDAARAFLRALGFWTKAADGAGALTTLANVGRMHLEVGRFEEALRFFSMALEGAPDDLGPRERLRLRLNVVQALLGDDQAPEALAQAQTAREEAKRVGLDRLEWLAQLEIARCLVHDRQLDRAEAALDALDAMTPADDDGFERAALDLAQGSLLARTAPDKAVPYLEKAMQSFVQDDLAAPEVEARLLLGECLHAVGEQSRSAQCFLIAETRARARRLTAPLERAQRALLQYGIDEEASGEARQRFARDTGNDELPYVIRERLGSGGFGTAYRAYDPERGREVALKIAKLGQEYDSRRRLDLIAAVQTELDALSRVRHPGVVRVHGAGETPTRDLYIVEEFIDGGGLRDAIGRINGFVQICDILAKVAFALDAVHRAKLVHRDLKPANILMRDASSPVLIDFGIAQIRANEDDPFVGVGTHDYMAPEMQAMEAVDARSDLYALGVIAHEWLTGALPDAAKNASRGLFRRARPASLTTYRPDIPDKLEDLVKALLSEDPLDRPRSARLVAQRFLDAVEGA